MEVQLTHEPSLLVASTTVTTSLSGIGEAIQAGFGSLVEAFGREGLSASGPPLVVYHDMISAATAGDIEICVPVEGAASADSAISRRELAGGLMASTVHRGPYEQIGPVYEALMAWIAEHGRAVVGPPREVYLNDPHAVPPEEILTRVEFPVSPDA